MQQGAQLMPDGYVLGHSSEEHERLLRSGRMQEPATRRVFHAVGLRPGWTCLDIGCGPGSVMQLMGELTGPSGEVTGIDRDAKAGRKAVERLDATGTSRYRFIEADMESIEVIVGAPFDLTFARRAVLNARDPVALLRKMYGWTKPGGCIAVQDIHIRTLNLYPKPEAFSELVRVIVETMERSGIDTEFAFKLPALFVEAGIGVPDGTDMYLPMTSLEPFATAFQPFVRSLLPRAIALGVTTEARMQSVFREIEQALIDGRQYSALWQLLVGVWKRKPALLIKELSVGLLSARDG
jgi:ubiquinone/menaquinone biosynthesis C-methylase UbiE